MEPGFLFIGVIILVIVIAIFAHMQAQKRRQMFADWASASGLRFIPDKDRHFDDQFPLPCFKRGSRRSAYNRCVGKRGDYSIVAGDYRYTTGSGDDKKTHTFSFFMVQPSYPLRDFALRPEHVFDKFSAAFGFDDIDFESAEFSKAFHVKCADRKWAYDVLHPRTMEFLLRHRKLNLQANPRAIVVQDGRDWQIPQFEHYANLLTEFLDAIPNHAREVNG